MTAILVWVLVTTSGAQNTMTLNYSPPVVDLESCQRMQAVASKASPYGITQCVQVKIYK